MGLLVVQLKSVIWQGMHFCEQWQFDILHCSKTQHRNKEMYGLVNWWATRTRETKNIQDHWEIASTCAQTSKKSFLSIHCMTVIFMGAIYSSNLRRKLIWQKVDCECLLIKNFSYATKQNRGMTSWVSCHVKNCPEAPVWWSQLLISCLVYVSGKNCAGKNCAKKQHIKNW